MFRLLKLNPPHGWRAVAWELGIVTAGVLIALAVQQWAEGRSLDERIALADEAIRDEMQQHYLWAFEKRVVAPCARAQVDELEKRVLASGTALTPSPLIATDVTTVVRIPSKDYNTHAYDEALGEGLLAKFNPDRRRLLSEHYGQARSMMLLTRQNDAVYQELIVLSQPIPLDAGVRYELLQMLSRLRGQIDFSDLIAGQLIYTTGKAKLTPPLPQAERETVRFGTYKYCRQKGFPMRSFAKAQVPIPS